MSSQGDYYQKTGSTSPPAPTKKLLKGGSTTGILLHLGEANQVALRLERQARAEEALERVPLAGERVDDVRSRLDEGSLGSSLVSSCPTMNEGEERTLSM